VTNTFIVNETMMLFIAAVKTGLEMNSLRKKVSYESVPIQEVLSFRLVSSSISDCREHAQDAGSVDSLADPKANQLGRNGGNCQTEYLCKVKCKYNPPD